MFTSVFAWTGKEVKRLTAYRRLSQASMAISSVRSSVDLQKALVDDGSEVKVRTE